ncbi:MAG: PIN domain-containing protein [Dongiaceae bacterium]
MRGYLFDTCAVSSLLNPRHQHHSATRMVVAGLPHGAPQFVSIVTIGEMEFGLKMAEHASSTHLAQFRTRIEAIKAYPVLDITKHTASAFAELKSQLALTVQRRANSQKLSRWLEDWIDANTGKQLQIDENDLWVAAQAKERDFTLISGDEDMVRLSKVDSTIRFILAR